MRYLIVPVFLLAGCAHNAAIVSHTTEGPSFHESQTRIHSSVDQMCSSNRELCQEVMLDDHVPSPGPFLPEP